MIKTRIALILVIVLSVTVLAERTKLKPGRNIYNPQQDVELGQEVAKDAERQLEIINNSKANAYISALGQQLVALSQDKTAEARKLEIDAFRAQTERLKTVTEAGRPSAVGRA